MPHLNQTKNMSNFMEALLRDPQRYRPIVEFLDQIIQNTSQLGWLDCERIGLALGRQNRSKFCAGIRSGMIKVLADNDDQTETDKLEPVIQLARKLNEDSSALEEKDIAIVRKAGWTDQTIEDVVGLVASFKVYSILANGLGFGSLEDAVFTDMGTATVSMRGYTPLFDSYIENMSAKAI